MSVDNLKSFNSRDMRTMPEKDPTNWTHATWALSIIMASAGGVVSWYGKVKAGHTKAGNIIDLVLDVFTSAFVGTAVFMAMDAIGHPIGLCAAAGGVGGHMGTRLLFILEKSLIESKLESEKVKEEDK